MTTPYQLHGQLGHHTTTFSPNGIDIIEECETCGARFLHNPAIGYPVSMRCLTIAQSDYCQLPD